jgi:hypothetical protein
MASITVRVRPRGAGISEFNAQPPSVTRAATDNAAKYFIFAVMRCHPYYKKNAYPRVSFQAAPVCVYYLRKGLIYPMKFLTLYPEKTR